MPFKAIFTSKLGTPQKPCKHHIIKGNNWGRLHFLVVQLYSKPITTKILSLSHFENQGLCPCCGKDILKIWATFPRRGKPIFWLVSGDPHSPISVAEAWFLRGYQVPPRIRFSPLPKTFEYLPPKRLLLRYMVYISLYFLTVLSKTSFFVFLWSMLFVFFVLDLT